ncbi:magnesium transporter CorA family protein [Salinicoccus hispanicus]|uniref:Mg2+ transporter protein, CorA-like protein n=1 Tax=Salinicoccus hispanicus TaxID=157225 RepID=A0A6N8TXE8_9STAP|nr:magnesium transporter CorA family protein [Salinicoccus hispanicus]MXQ50112.1 Mg2+ transporter protein, CorA-like protein [Salinicoccus hispanicus]
MKRHVLNNDGWTWIEMDFSDKATMQKQTSGYPVDEQWLDQANEGDSNNLQMDTTYEGKEVIWGSLIYDHNLTDPDSGKFFHFCLTRDFLLTDYLDFDIFNKINTSNTVTKMDFTHTPIEGFMVIINVILNNYLQKIDDFEKRINNLLWKLEKKNNEEVLSQIMNCRHQLIVLKSLILPLKEIELGVPEAFGEETKEGSIFYKMQQRIDRAFTLVTEYSKEIGSMAELESVKADVRGNEIMKTLTIVTVLFTPVMAWGALWGMNFTYMPELDFKYGYLFAGLLIIVNTAAIYLFLRNKGWMGDLLNNTEQTKKKKKSSSY